MTLIHSFFSFLFVLLGKPVSSQDGSHLDFSNWSSTAGTGKKSGSQCAVMVAGNGGNWNLVPCESSYSRVVCKTKASEYHNRCRDKP